MVWRPDSHELWEKGTNDTKLFRERWPNDDRQSFQDRSKLNLIKTLDCRLFFMLLFKFPFRIAEHITESLYLLIFEWCRIRKGTNIVASKINKRCSSSLSCYSSLLYKDYGNTNVRTAYMYKFTQYAETTRAYFANFIPITYQ